MALANSTNSMTSRDRVPRSIRPMVVTSKHILDATCLWDSPAASLACLIVSRRISNSNVAVDLLIRVPN